MKLSLPHGSTPFRHLNADEDSLTFARAPRDKGVTKPEIVKKLTIKTGEYAGQHPSIASLLPRPRRHQRLLTTVETHTHPRSTAPSNAYCPAARIPAPAFAPTRAGDRPAA